MKLWTLKRDAKGLIVGSVQDKIVLHMNDVSDVKDVKIKNNKNIVCLVELWTSDLSLPLGIVEFDRNGKKISEIKIRKPHMMGGEQSESMLYDPSLQKALTCKVYGVDEMFKVSFFECPTRKLIDLEAKRMRKRLEREYMHFSFTDISIEISPCKQVAALVTLFKPRRPLLYSTTRRRACRVRVHLISTQKPYKVLHHSNTFSYETDGQDTTVKIFSKFANGGRMLVISIHEGFEVQT